MIILKVTENQRFTLSLEEKPQGGQIDPPSRFRVNIANSNLKVL